MALKTYCASAHRKKDLQVEVKARDFSIIVDEPENSGGTNTGMNPVEMLLCSIGACQTITAVIFADFYGITLEDIQVEVTGEMDSDGFLEMIHLFVRDFRNYIQFFILRALRLRCRSYSC